MFLIDTHAHLFSAEFQQDVDSVMRSAEQIGVQKIVLPNIDLESIDAMLQLSAKYPSLCYPALGLHPGSVDAHFEDALSTLKPLFAQHKFCAVGEIGIDLYWDKTFNAEQKIAFEEQIKWAKELKLPIIIHVRESFTEVFEIVDRQHSADLFGVFHCFTGNAQQARHVLDYGNFKLGIGGVVTYKTSTLPDVLKTVPLDALVLETDSPYLPPVPFRGKRNESAYLLHIAKKLSEVYATSVDEIAEITSRNAKAIFNLAQ